MPSSSRSRPAPLSRQVQISKLLCWLLRHGASSENLPLDPSGYADLSLVLSNRKLRGLKISLSEIQELVRDNDKQRFNLILNPALITSDEDVDPAVVSKPGNYLIRANQGHSLKGVASEGLLKEITLPPGDDDEAGGKVVVAVHGTGHRAWTEIVKSGGLKRMGRNHVHFARGLPPGFEAIDDGEGKGGAEAALPVISGMRNRSTVLIYVDVEKAINAGIKFWVSDNGVILSEGNGEGMVPLEYFKKVEDRTGEGILVSDGKVVKEAPGKWAAGGKR